MMSVFDTQSPQPATRITRYCLLLVVALVGAACAPESETSTLVVGLRTDLSVTHEFDGTELFLSPLEGLAQTRRERVDAEGIRYLPSGRLLEFPDLPSGEYRLDMILTAPQNTSLLAEQTALVSVNSNTSLTMAFDRSCLNIQCPPSDDPSTAVDESTLIACLGGRCVSPRCSLETPEACGGTKLCAVDEECVAPASCAVGECVLGVCWYAPDDNRSAASCDSTEWCHPERGCVPAVDWGNEGNGSGAVGGELCRNGVIDEGEAGVDCGGPCGPCSDGGDGTNPSADHCLDGVRNENESGIDCGGECSPCSSLAPSCIDTGAIPVHECHALAAFYSAANMDRSIGFADWFGGQSPCTWTGLECRGGHIVGFELVQNDASGRRLFGHLAPAIFNLRELETFRLRLTDLTGSLPPEVGHLTKVQSFRVGADRFSGQLPDEIGQLAAVEMLQLNEDFVGTLPPSLGSLSQVRWIEVGTTDRSAFRGTLPPELGNLSKLEELYLRRGALEGPIPESFNQLTRMRRLFLDGNRLVGAVPEGLRNHPFDGTFTLVLHDNACLWTMDCDVMKSWLDSMDSNWSVSPDPDCSPPPGACQ